MAFQSGTMQRRCAKCHEPGKLFKLYQSFREEHVWKEGEKPMATLFCVTCEVQNREEEWEKWTTEQKELAGENYPTIEASEKTRKVDPKRSGLSAVSQSGVERRPFRPFVRVRRTRSALSR